MTTELTPRLKIAADKIKKSKILCDIGCDHAYLPIYLLKKGIIEYAYACDVRDGPLAAAKKNIRLNGLEDKISTVLSDGLKGIRDIPADCISICGMGGILISDIIKNSINYAMNAGSLILQPMTEICVLRKFLYDNEFEIYDEALAVEGDRYYSIICAKKGNSCSYDAFDCFFGTKIFENNDPHLKGYIEKNFKNLSYNLSMKKKSGRENTEELEFIVKKLGEKMKNF